MVERRQKLDRAERMLSTELGREPMLQEVAERAGLSLPQALELEAAARTSTSLDQPLVSLEDALFGDVIAGDGPLPEEIVDNTFRHEALGEAMGLLGEREHTVISLRFGLDGTEPKTLGEIGGRLGFSRERARQLETKSAEASCSAGGDRARWPTDPRGGWREHVPGFPVGADRGGFVGQPDVDGAREHLYARPRRRGRAWTTQSCWGKEQRVGCSPLRNERGMTVKSVLATGATAALLTASACGSQKTQHATPQAPPRTTTATRSEEPTIKEQADRYLAIVEPVKQGVQPVRYGIRQAEPRHCLA